MDQDEINNLEMAKRFKQFVEANGRLPVRGQSSMTRITENTLFEWFEMQKSLRRK